MSATSILLVVVGLVVLVVGAEALVRGSSRLAVAVGISPLVVGLTVVAFGTSSPELAVGIQAALDGQTDLALGNVVGSNMFNVLGVLGVASLITIMIVRQTLVRRELPLVALVSAVVLLMALNGDISRIEGVALFLGVIVYTVWAIRTERSEPDDVVAEYEAETPETPSGGRAIALNVVIALTGLGLLVLGARWLVSGATDIATDLGMSELLIGVTIVAIGTSLPELATSVVAAVRGERDIAVGNVVGSNLFNLLAVLGASAALSANGVPVSDEGISFQLPALVVISVLCLGIFFTRLAVHRWEGAALLGLYVVYLAYCIVEATDTGSVTAMRLVAVGAVVFVAVGVVISTVRARRLGNPAAVVEPSGPSAGDV